MREPEPPPGPPAWAMYVVPMLFPAGFLLAFALGRLLPLPDAAFPAIAIGVPMASVVIWAFWDKSRKRRAAGLVPAESGYSAQVLLLAEKLRERAQEIDTALRFARDVGAQHELESLTNEVRRTALEIDKRELVAFLTHEHFVGGTTEAVGRAEWPGRVGRLREAADELEAYANDVRARGGVFKGKPHEVAGCSLILLAMAGGGAWLVFVAGSWFWGLALVAAASVLTWALIGSQTDPA